MMLLCPLCNNDLTPEGRHVRLGNGCSYSGPGLTRQQVVDAAQGFRLGAVDPDTEHHNGVGCYDSDADFA